MFFTRLAQIIAVLGFVAGAFRAGLAFAIVLGLVSQEALPRYLGSGTTGQVIDHGIYMMIVSIILGTLTEISIGIRRGRS